MNPANTLFWMVIAFFVGFILSAIVIFASPGNFLALLLAGVFLFLEVISLCSYWIVRAIQQLPVETRKEYENMVTRGR